MTRALSPKSFAGILGETFRIYGNNYLRLLAIVALGGVLRGILEFLLPLEAIIIERKIESVPLFILREVIGNIDLLVVFPLIGGALIHAVSEQKVKQTVSVGRAFRFAWGRLGALIGASLLAFLVIFGTFVTMIGIPVAIYFMVRWAFIRQAALLESLGPRAALSRSSDLVKGNWWRVLGIMLVVYFVTGAISVMLWKIGVLGTIIGIILLAPFAETVITLLYYDLRVRKEGYGLETLARELHININGMISGDKNIYF